MSTQPEKAIEYQILSFLRTIGLFVFKVETQGTYDAKKGVYRRNNNPYKLKGVADILGIIQGRFLAIEVKSDKGRVSDEQRIFLRHIQEEGGIAFVARSVEQVAEELLKHLPDNPKLKQFCKEYIQSKGMDH